MVSTNPSKFFGKISQQRCPHSLCGNRACLARELYGLHLQTHFAGLPEAREPHVFLQVAVMFLDLLCPNFRPGSRCPAVPSLPPEDFCPESLEARIVHEGHGGMQLRVRSLKDSLHTPVQSGHYSSRRNCATTFCPGITLQFSRRLQESEEKIGIFRVCTLQGLLTLVRCLYLRENKSPQL